MPSDHRRAGLAATGLPQYLTAYRRVPLSSAAAAPLAAPAARSAHCYCSSVPDAQLRCSQLCGLHCCDSGVPRPAGAPSRFRLEAAPTGLLEKHPRIPASRHVCYIDYTTLRYISTVWIEAGISRRIEAAVPRLQRAAISRIRRRSRRSRESTGAALSLRIQLYVPRRPADAQRCRIACIANYQYSIMLVFQCC